MYSASSANNGPSAQLTPYLRPGELLLWSGRPDPDVRFTGADAYLVPFSVMWAGFAVFWESAALSSGAPFFFKLWGIPFVAIGLYIVFGRFIFKKRRKRRTAYGITKQRALIATGATSIADMPLASTPTEISKKRDGRHVSVVFGQVSGSRMIASYGNTGMEYFTRGRAPSFAFYDVANPQDLLSALEQANTSK